MSLIMRKLQWTREKMVYIPTCRTAKRIFGPQAQKETCPPPPILQLMILKLSPPQYLVVDKIIRLLFLVYKNTSINKCTRSLWLRVQTNKQVESCFLNHNSSIHFCCTDSLFMTHCGGLSLSIISWRIGGGGQVSLLVYLSGPLIITIWYIY
jgi:hypothetical protein